MAISAHLDQLTHRHRAIEERIQEERSRPLADDVKLAQLKREKLKIKDEITRLSNDTRH